MENFRKFSKVESFQNLSGKSPEIFRKLSQSGNYRVVTSAAVVQQAEMQPLGQFMRCPLFCYLLMSVCIIQALQPTKLSQYPCSPVA